MLQDFRFALRLARKSPATTLTIFVVLALAIGGTTAIFSIVDAVLFRPLPFRDSARLTRIFATDSSHSDDAVSMPDYLDWKKNVSGFSEMALFQTSQATLTGVALPERVVLGSTEASLFNLLGAIPVRGNFFPETENAMSQPDEALLSWNFWRTHFHGEDVLGHKLMLDGKPFLIVGVLPRSFAVFGRKDVWIPLALDLTGPKNKRGYHIYEAVGRLAPGVTIDQVNAQLAARSAALAQAFPAENQGVGARAIELRNTLSGEGIGANQGNFRHALFLLFAAVGTLLLIACGNVATINLVNASSRQHELAVRISVGAGRGRLFRQVMMEGVVISFSAALAGIAFAWALVKIFKALPITTIPRMDEIGIDMRVLGFAIALGVFTGVIAGLIPAIRAAGANLSLALKQGSGRTTDSRSQQHLRRLFVAFETCLAALLLVQSGLLLKSFIRVVDIHPALQVDHLLTMYVSLPMFDAKHLNNPAIPALIQQLIRKLEELPGVRSAATASSLPLTGTASGAGVLVQGRVQPRQLWQTPYADWSVVSPKYFRTLGIPLISGRDFDSDSPSRKIVIVNQALVHTLFSGQDAVGAKISGAFQSPDWYEVIGVVADVPQETLEKKAIPELFFPSEASDQPWMALALQVSGNPLNYVGPARRAIAKVNSSVAVFLPRTMRDILGRQVVWRGLQTYVIGAFALLAIALAGLGIYAVIAHSVNQRTREIGLRMALGASNQTVMRMVIWQGILPALIGGAVGLLASLWIGRLTASVLFGVAPLDPEIYVGATVLLAAAAAAATYFPAKRASMLDPSLALRNE